MVTEHALLPVVPGREREFEEAFREARTIIAASPGFVSLSLSCSMESPSLYLLLVEWERVSDHTVGFRRSPGYARWSELLHPFYDPFPVVKHFRSVL